MSYSFSGVVEHGSRRGSDFGFPTINVSLPDAVALELGVYFSRVTFADGTDYFGVTNVGVHPTVDPKPRPISETYLFCERCEGYGQTVTVQLLQFLRREERFENVEALKQQIARDVERAKQLIQLKKASE